MKSKILSLIIFLSAMFCNSAIAQTTHAHSSSRQWKGIDVHSYLTQAEASSNTTGTPIYLYNVGTGRFVIEGGGWGMEGRLFYEDFGRQMNLIVYNSATHTGKIHSGITETNISDNKHMFTCNIPTIMRNKGWTTAYNYVYTTIMDGSTDESEWYFVPVENGEDTSKYHTYYMYQIHSGKYQGTANRSYYLGAAYGEWCSDGTTEYADGSSNNKGTGYYVNVDDDRTCWTTAGQAGDASSYTPPYENTTKVLVNGDSVPICELYQWRLISQEEFERVLNEEVQGLNPSVSSLIADRDFTRNADDFFNNWMVTAGAITTDSIYRYSYTWGNIEKRGNQQSSRYNSEPWDSPVRLKVVFDNMKNAKYGFMCFEGIGTVSTTVTVPKAGWYQIEANSLCFGPEGHTSYMYATAGNITVTDALRSSSNRAYNGYNEIDLSRMETLDDFAAAYPDISFGNTNSKSVQAFNNAVGMALTLHNNDYRKKFWVYLSPEMFAVSPTITIGFRKDYATRSSNYWTQNSIYYYYDTDWLIADDVKMSYMGVAPAFLYESETSLQYLVYDEDSIAQRPAAVPTYRYSGALGMVRSLKKGQWNSFSCCIPLTGEQVRIAFGEDAKLVELVGIGTLSKNSNVIDFRSVGLKPVDPLTAVVQPGKFYMLWPTKDPVTGNVLADATLQYYDLGRNFFSVNTDEPSSYSHYILDTSILYNSYYVTSYNGGNDGYAHVTFCKTPEYSIFAIDGDGYNTIGATDGMYAPKGSYAVANGTIYELNRDTPIKGFRGWIILDHSIFGNTSASSTLRMSIDGILDDDLIAAIDDNITIIAPSAGDGIVYDMSGRAVGPIGTKLPSGVYIVNGKKLYVR